MANRPNILALASKISLESMTYTGITYKDPEYRILEPIVDDDMCSVMMRMRLEKEFSAEELAKKYKKSVEYVQEQCDKLVAVGAIRVRYRGRQRGRGLHPPREGHRLCRSTVLQGASRRSRQCSGGSRKAHHQEDRKKVRSRYARDRSCPLNGQNRHRFCRAKRH